MILTAMSELDGGNHRDWLADCRRRVVEFRAPWLSKHSPGEQMTGRDIVDAIRPLLSEEMLFLIDGGNIGQWAHMALGDHYPGRWLTCGASAVVGWGIPGAMAARLAEPERPILLLSGDGAFGFTITELESAARQELPFVVVVANDSAWGIVVCGQRDAWGSTVACETRDIRFDQIAESMGARGIRVTDPAKITGTIQEGFGSPVPVVIDVPIRVFSPTNAKAQGSC
jgi:acetolactate synthase-1/2/3 large subunit